MEGKTVGLTGGDGAMLNAVVFVEPSTDGTVNATVPKGTDPASVTLDRALELLSAREDKLRSQGKDPRAPKKRRGRRKA